MENGNYYIDFCYTKYTIQLPNCPKPVRLPGAMICKKVGPDMNMGKVKSYD